jgi:outer membrane receptor protein involved in Fe transport
MKVITAGADSRPRVCDLSLAIAELVRSRRAAGGAILASAFAIVPVSSVVAQDQQAEQGVLEEVVVTGSRIVRQDFSANSPIQTVDQTAFEDTSAVGVETVLNRLPQFVPAVTQFTTGDVQQTATNTVGASTVSLRGLGANRNLVLINGRRAMPVNPAMTVDTNSIPATAIQRVEVISGGASAVYGADAVGGVVNFILKDNYEGASIDVRFGDTQHGGEQNVTLSALFGVNAGDDRGNIMLGIERTTRAKQNNYERDWRVEDYANPNTTGGFFAFGSATWFHNEPGTFGNDPSQAAVDAIFNPATGACPYPNDLNLQNNIPPPGPPNPFFVPVTVDDDPNNLCRISPTTGFGGTNFRINRDGSVFTGLAGDSALSRPGAHLFNGPVYGDPGSPGGDLDGDLLGLPVFVRTADGKIKENNLYSWASSPRETLSAFSSGHFDISDNIRVTGQAMVTRSEVQQQLGLSSANINQWGAGIPFGTALYRGNPNTYFDIPDSLCTAVGPGCSAVGVTNASYTPTGIYGVDCDSPATPDRPWLDGQPGCTNSEAWPVPAQIYNLMQSRALPNNVLWASREPDWLRSALGAGRAADNVTTTMSFSVGLEGDFPSGDHSWDMSLYTGRSDNTVNQIGSTRLTTYRDILTSPNFGRNATFDSNPWEFGGFAESTAKCTSGLPIADDREVSADCVQMVAPSLKNITEVDQTIFEANLVGDIVEMRAGPLQYAAGFTYRENGFTYTPDNLSDFQNEADPIAGLFPTETSTGEFDVSELYGELLIPIVDDGPAGVEHFTVELGGRVSDWSMEQMPNLETYKALIDWGITPRYRIRGGYNRAFRAPNLGELFLQRTQIFGAANATRDWCSTNLNAPGGFSATPPGGPGTPPSAQSNQSLAICQTLMGPQGTQAYYFSGTSQPTAGTAGIPITFGNPQLREEQADTFTMGIAMDLFDDWRLTVDYWHIEIENMIAVESADATYQRCLDMQFNPTGSVDSPACQQIFRNPVSGAGAYINRSYNNLGASNFEGVDAQITWSHQLEGGGSLNVNSSLTYNLHEKTRDRPDLPESDWTDAGGQGNCSLQLQCLNYQYRIFSTVGYGRGMWNLNFTHQYWPDLPNLACRTNPLSQGCVYNSLPAYSLFSAATNVRFGDRYTLRVGIENLLDEEPPCLNANPGATPFPTACTHVGGFGPAGDAATYDPLGRRYFVTMSMEF